MEWSSQFSPIDVEMPALCMHLTGHGRTQIEEVTVGMGAQQREKIFISQEQTVRAVCKSCDGPLLVLGDRHTLRASAMCVIIVTSRH